MPDQSAIELSDLSDEQLSRYQRELEKSLTGLAPNTPVRDLIGHKLTLVRAEGARRHSGPRRH